MLKYTSAGGVVMFSRALRLYKRQGIRVNVLCPEVRSNLKNEYSWLYY